MVRSVHLRYGEGEIQVDVADGVPCQVIRKPVTSPIEDPSDAIREALENPVGAESLDSAAKRAKSACIAICDITRPVPNALFLRPLIEKLTRAGLALDQICIVIATGLHRPNLGKELEELIGDPWVIDRIKIWNHQAEDDLQHVLLGKTETRGTVVRLDRRFVEADLKIVTGLVEPHFMAGYSGGRKVIAPGLAHSETIRTFHNARFMGDPAAANCNLVGNPLHEEQLEIVRMIGEVYSLNTVIDEARRLIDLNFGEVIASHQAIVDRARSFCEVSVEQRFSTILTSAAGYPLDKTYYQTIKGMVGALGVLKRGGDLIIASECSEGFGSKAFRDAQEKLVHHGSRAFLAQISEKSLADIDEWQTQKQIQPMEHGEIHLYTKGLNREEQSLTGVRCVTNLQDTLNECLKKSANPSLGVIPEGPYVIPQYKEK